MAERRPLGAGLKVTDVNTDLERQFVYQEKGEPAPPKLPTADTREPRGPTAIARVPFTTRVRADYGAALKRASLERQLSNEFPNTVQDILDDALEPWLRSHGYIQ
jgi:hypothetical protein